MCYLIYLQSEVKCAKKDENSDDIIPNDFSLNCPEGCITYRKQNLSNPIFELHQNGTLSLKEVHQNVKVKLLQNKGFNRAKTKPHFLKTNHINISLVFQSWKLLCWLFLWWRKYRMDGRNKCLRVLWWSDFGLKIW